MGCGVSHPPPPGANDMQNFCKPVQPTQLYSNPDPRMEKPKPPIEDYAGFDSGEMGKKDEDILLSISDSQQELHLSDASNITAGNEHNHIIKSPRSKPGDPEDNQFDEDSEEHMDDDDDDVIEEPVVTIRDRDRDAYDGEFHPFIEFPTPLLLREANKAYSQLKLGGEKDEDGVVLPYPPPKLKQNVCKTEQFAALDKHALQASKSLLKGPVKNLVDYLIKPAKNDIQKTRVIFRWITAQVLSTLDPELTEIPDTVYWYLGRVKDMYADYTELFLEMCEHAQLTGMRVDGYGKGVSYELGEGNDLNSCKTSWAAVLIDNAWRLVNPHWGSCFVTSSEKSGWLLIDDNGMLAKQTTEVNSPKIDNSPPKTEYVYNDFYFLTDPEEFIYKLKPVDCDELQLLARPVTSEEFMAMAYLKEGFFELGLEVLSHRKCDIYVEGGHVEIDIGLPAGKKRSFTYRMWVSEKGKKQELNIGDIGLDRYVFLWQNDGVLQCSLDFPVSGIFKFELFARDGDEIVSDKSTNSNLFRLVCSYIIHCELPKEDCVPLPKISRKEWGPGTDMERIGLKAVSHNNAIVELEEGLATIVFEGPDVKILHEMHSNTKSKEKLENFVIQRKESGRIVMDVKVPEEGQYALNLYAKQDDEDGAFPNVCTYLLTSETAAADPKPFPKIPRMFCGATDSNADLKIQLISHDTTYIIAPPSGEMDIVFSTSIPCDLLGSLTLQTDTGEEELDDYVFKHQDSSTCTFCLRFPQKGVYKLQIYGKREDEMGNSYPNIYNIIIEVPSPMLEGAAFPESFESWGRGCQLIEPNTLELKQHHRLNFVVRLDGAEDVVVINHDDEWVHLTKHGDGLWRAEVETGIGGKELKMAARRPDNSDNYDHLLAFKVISDDVIGENAEKQEALRKELEAAAKKEREQKAKREKLFEKIAKELQLARKSRKAAKIRKALQSVIRHGFRVRLEKEVTDARKLLLSLERLDMLRRAILDLDTACMTEVRGYGSPPYLVHDVLIASLLLLGELESVTKDWDECRKFCNTIGPMSMYKRVKRFEVERLHPEIAARARQILQQYRPKEIRDTSATASAFYLWAVGVIEEIQLMRTDAAYAKPANINRQQEIFTLLRKRRKKKRSKHDS